MPQEPGWEALLISFPRPPQIGFDLKVAGGLITQQYSVLFEKMKCNVSENNVKLLQLNKPKTSS